jgi:hypothetical protein
MTSDEAQAKAQRSKGRKKKFSRKDAKRAKKIFVSLRCLPSWRLCMKSLLGVLCSFAFFA